MTSITIYKGKHEIFRETIYQEFHIVESPSGELFWYENMDVNRPGVSKIWLQASETPRLPFVLPDWQLIIDNTWMKNKFYEDVQDLIDLRGKVIELRYREYRFVFQIDL
jgi:hypothetical protein